MPRQRCLRRSSVRRSPPPTLCLDGTWGIWPPAHCQQVCWKLSSLWSISLGFNPFLVLPLFPLRSHSQLKEQSWRCLKYLSSVTSNDGSLKPQTWTPCRWYLKLLEQFHMQSLRLILNICWQGRITNWITRKGQRQPALKPKFSEHSFDGLTMLSGWTDESRILRQLLYSDLSQGRPCKC